MTELLTEMNWLIFLISLAVIEFSPGSNTCSLSSFDERDSKTNGIAVMSGVILGRILQLTTAAIAIQAIYTYSPGVFPYVITFGFIVTFWLANDAFSEIESLASRKLTKGKVFKRSMFSNLFTAKAVVFYLVVVVQLDHLNLSSMLWPIITIGGIGQTIVIAAHALCLLLGVQVNKTIQTWRTSSLMRTFFCISLIALAVFMAIYSIT